MNATVEFVSGRCTNEMYCAVASAGDVLRLPAGARFVCSYCGGKLIEAPPAQRRIGLRAGMIIGGGMGMTGLGLFAVGFWLGDAPAPTATVVAKHVAQAPATVAPTLARIVVAPTLPPPAVTAIAPPVAVAAEARQDVERLEAPPSLQLAQRVDSWAGAPRPVPITLAMAERPIIKPPLAPRQNAAAPAKQEPKLAAVSAPTPDAPDADGLNAREAARLAAPPPVQTVALVMPRPAPAAGPSRAFVPQPIVGGAPSYPAAYDSAERKGRVTVSCHIEVSGLPTGCRVVSTEGGEAFATEVHNWLGSGHVRFAPILHGGHAAAETHQWNVDFQPLSGS